MPLDRYYVLRGREPVPCDASQCAEEMALGNRVVRRTRLGPFLISTVFLGVNHSFLEGRPILFETMVFEGSSSRETCIRRCATWEEAEVQHEATIVLMKKYVVGNCSPVEEEPGRYTPRGLEPVAKTPKLVPEPAERDIEI